MRFRKLTNFALAAALAAAPAALSTAFAATPADVQPGMTVVDPAGGTVGTVVGISGDNLILKTSKHEVQLPMSSFTASEGKLLFAMTAAQLDAETEKAMAEASASVTTGAKVFGSDGTLAGTIEAVDDQLVTIKLTGGETVRLPRNAVAGGNEGARLGMTTEQLGQLASQASQTAAGDPAATPSDSPSASN
jgi:preprotein translocase subunit YajC